MTERKCSQLLCAVILLFVTSFAMASVRPRILVSTDIGGTDPDDNQSMIHLLMYSDRFDIEGLVSSPSFGEGSAKEIKRMISIYAKDYTKLKANAPGLVAPDSLASLCKQGRKGLAPFKGYGEPTEGSDWIVRMARKDDPRPLWVLVWGTLEDVAQALHDAPDIESRIRVYWIGGPNKKWGVNSYAYIAANFPDLWMIEANATYRGFIADGKNDGTYDKGYYDYAMRGAGHMGADFINYYKGVPKMGDTPSLLYMMDGDPENPMKECWGGSFVRFDHSSRRIYDRPLTVKDTVPVYSVMELRFKGPVTDIPEGQPCFTVTIDKQKWDGYYVGGGTYVVRYAPKAPARLSYNTSSIIKELDGLSGEFVVDDVWPGKPNSDDYKLGRNWFTDRPDRSLYEGGWQGAASVRKWRKAVLDDWSLRWSWLRVN